MTEAVAVWSRRLADELWSGPVTPLTFGVLADTMADHMVRRTLRQAGLDELATVPVLRLYASHVYVNGALLVAVMNLLPPVLRSEGLVALLPPSLLGTLEPTPAISASARTAAMALRFLVREPAWAPWRRAAAFDAASAAVRRRFATSETTAATATEPATLYAQMQGVRAELGTYLETVSWGIVFAYVFYHALQELCRRWAPGFDGERAALTVGLPGVVSLEAAREIAALGAVARDGTADAAALDAILARHGHRLTGRDLACPTWRETPDVVVDLARRAGESPHATALARAAERRRTATARIEDAIGRGIAGDVRVAVFRATLDAAQRYYVVRENMRYYADFFLARLRELALALGASLVRDDRLADAADVCFLDFDELGRALGEPADLRPRVATRRAAYTRDSATPPPAVLDVAPAAEAPSTLAGDCAAPGRCRGRARIVHGPADFARVGTGDVLIAAYTDPAWTPILELAAGLVLEAGGQLSHGAIVARELGIPALVNVAAATRTLRDGELVEIDATAGVVRVVGSGG